jgi:hypothetical protein
MSVPSCPIAQAAQFLASDSGTTKERLIIGGKMLWAVTTLSKDWSPSLVEKSKRAQRVLITGGSIPRTVDGMNEKTAAECLKQLTKEMAELAAELEQARNQRRVTRK